MKIRKVKLTQHPACRLGSNILKAERQIKRGRVVRWDEMKRQHGL